MEIGSVCHPPLVWPATIGQEAKVPLTAWSNKQTNKQGKVGCKQHARGLQLMSNRRPWGDLVPCEGNGRTRSLTHDEHERSRKWSNLGHCLYLYLYSSIFVFVFVLIHICVCICCSHPARAVIKEMIEVKAEASKVWQTSSYVLAVWSAPVILWH